MIVSLKNATKNNLKAFLEIQIRIAYPHFNYLHPTAFAIIRTTIKFVVDIQNLLERR